MTSNLIQFEAAQKREQQQHISLKNKKKHLDFLPSDWSICALEEIGQCLIGLTYEPRYVSPDGLLVLRSSNIGNYTLQLDDFVFVSMEVPDQLILREDDLLICVRNGSRPLIGKCTLIDHQASGMTFGAFMSVFRSADNRFVFYCFQSDIVKHQIHEHLGATINQITNSSLNSFLIPYPSAKERNIIADALSDVDGLITSLEALFAKKKAIKLAAMQQLLTGKIRLPGFSGVWETISMGHIGSVYSGLSGKTKADFSTGNARYVTFLNVLENVILDTELFENVHITHGEVQNQVTKGDILFNGTSETPDDLAMGAVVGEQKEHLYLNSFCFGFRLYDQSKYHPVFLAYFYRGTTGRAKMYALAQGATRYNLSKAQFLKLELSIPEIDEQSAIATILSDMDTEIVSLKRRLDKTRAIKQGMMQQLLTGRVRLFKPK